MTHFFTCRPVLAVVSLIFPDLQVRVVDWPRLPVPFPSTPEVNPTQAKLL